MIPIVRENRYFLPFWLARIVSQVGDGIHSLAILWFSYNVSKSPAVVGLVMISVSLPGILVSPFAGNLADRVNRKIIMAAADFVRFVSVGILAVLAFYHLLGLLTLVLISAVMSVASAFFNPTAMAVLPQIVKKEFLTKANALSQITANVSMILGPLIGMTLISVIGISVAFGLNAISFILSGTLILRIKTALPEVPSKREGFFETLKNGVKLLKKYPIAYKMLDKAAVINFFFSSIVIVIPILSGTVYRMGAKGIGYMMSAFGFGMLISSLVLSFGKLGFTPKAKLTVSLFVMGAFLISFGTIYNFNMTLLSLFFIGFSINFANINLISLYQEFLPNEILGRVMAFLSAIALSLQPFSYGVTGVLVDAAGIRLFMAVSGVIVMVSALRIWFIKELGGDNGRKAAV
ncbi:MAG: MFS transporter [Acidobacteria bacterium]|nr:MFS transporter [Acidobacteriota bacterium]